MVLIFTNQSIAAIGNHTVNFSNSLFITSQNEISIHLQFRLPAYKRTHTNAIGSDGERIRYISQGGDAPEIAPDIPVITKLFIIPDGMMAEVKILNQDSKVESDYYPISHVFSEGFSEYDENDDVLIDRMWSKYLMNSNTNLPVQLDKPVIMRNYRLLPVSIHPFSYDKESHTLHIIENIEFELTFRTDPNAEQYFRGLRTPQPSRYIDKIISNLVMNPPPLRDEGINGGAIAYVIGDWDNVAESLEPLIEWRRKMGWTVDLIRVENNSERADIKQAILTAYEEWDITPEYVVLVGDAPGMENNVYKLAYWNVQNGANTAYETDHKYSTLAGDDILPEVAIGRLVFNSIDMLEGQIEKIISYESDPYMPQEGDDVNWQTRAAVAATDSRSGKSSIDICRWFKYLALEHGYEQVDEFYWSNQNRQRNPLGFLNETIENGVSFVLYRGWSHMNGYTPRDASQHRNGRMLPFVMLATCNTGDYGQNLQDPNWCYIERFAWSSIGGAIGAVGAAGATHTAYNNLFATSTMKAPFVDEIYSQGWATMAGKLELMKHYSGLGDIDHPENRGMEAWLTEFYIFNLMGDPAVELFTAVPRVLNVTHAEDLRQGESKFSVRVNFDDNDAVATDTRVCLYMPNEFQQVEYTDSDGVVDFMLDPSLVDEGSVYLTVSGPNLKPYSIEFEIEDARYFLGATSFLIDDDDEGESIGDDDRIANPNERIELSVEISNLGNRTPNGEVTVVLVPQSPHISIEDNIIVIGGSPEPDESDNMVFLVDIEGGFPNRTLAKFDVVISAGESEWSSSFAFQVEGAQIEIGWIEWEDNELMPGDTATAIITIINEGERGTADLEGELISMTNTIRIVDGDVSFEAIAAGDEIEANRLVTIVATNFHLSGAKADFALALEDADGFQDTAYYDMTISRVRRNEPFGQDNYGYICVDNTAEGYAIHPRFDWIEIDPNLGGRGTDTGLHDRAEEYDRSVVIDLPFEFVYYGESFNQLTICSNGWVAFGDYELLNSARNRHIPSGEVAPAMLCPFWDDLITPNNAGIYYWYDEQVNRFIVEYSNLRRLGPQNNNEPTETFEVILLDPANNPTQTGDGDIIFQYLEVEDSRSAFQLWDTPYATVGIGSVDQTDGIEYTYWGQLHPGAAPLEPERAIKFTTMTEYHTVNVTGSVLDAETGEPIPGAKVSASYGNFSLTEEDGTFVLGETLPFDNYSFTASKVFFSDSTISGVAVELDEEIELIFRLNHPEFVLDPGKLSLESVYVDSISTNFQIENSGNGVLQFDSKIEFSSEVEIWDQMLDIQVEEDLDDSEVRGIVWADDYWIVAGGGNGVIGENWFYKFNINGHYRGRISQPVESRFGIRDMEFVDGSLYGINSYNNNQREILKIDPETGEILLIWDLSEQNIYFRALAIDPEAHRLYVAGTSPGIYEYEIMNDSTLSYIGSHEIMDDRTDRGIHPYGLALYSDDPDGYSLYLYNTDEPLQNDTIPDVSVYKVDVNNWSTMFVTGLEFLSGSARGRGGICITPNWSNTNWVMAAVVDARNEDDYIAVFNLGDNSTWIEIEPVSGELLPQEVVDVELILHTENLDSGSYEFNIEYVINADPGNQTLPVSVSVLVNIPTSNITSPDEFSLMQNWPNPFNSTTRINFNLKTDQIINLEVIDSMGRQVASLIDNKQTEAGQHTISFEQGNFSAGVYFYRLQAGSQIAVRKMVLLK